MWCDLRVSIQVDIFDIFYNIYIGFIIFSEHTWVSMLTLKIFVSVLQPR
jgi:hypothetical protein